VRSASSFVTPHTWICEIALPKSYEVFLDFVTAGTSTDSDIQLKLF